MPQLNRAVKTALLAESKRHKTSNGNTEADIDAEPEAEFVPVTAPSDQTMPPQPTPSRSAPIEPAEPTTLRLDPLLQLHPAPSRPVQAERARPAQPEMTRSGPPERTQPANPDEPSPAPPERTRPAQPEVPFRRAPPTTALQWPRDDIYAPNLLHLLLDGGLGTHLEALGADISSTPLWSSSLLESNPALIQQAHLDFFRAGASIATTASYQTGLLEPVLLRRSVELAMAARKQAYVEQERQGRRDVKMCIPKQLWVAGSIGPYGAHLANGSEYTGAYEPMPDREGFKKYHRQRVRVLKDAGVDIFALETMPCLTEVEAVLELLEEEAEGMACWVSVSLKEGGEVAMARAEASNDPLDMMKEMSQGADGSMADGTPLAKLAELAREKANVVAVGVNCVKSEAVFPALWSLHKRMQDLDDATNTRLSKALICYPNSGETWDGQARGWKRKRDDGRPGARPKNLEDYLDEWSNIAIGRLFIVGGCCRVGPEETKRMGTWIDRFVDV